MDRRVVSFVSGIIVGASVLVSPPADAQPAGSWSCNAVSGNVFIPQQLHSAGTSAWNFKGLGWAVNCDNTLNTGSPIVAASYKFAGKHSGPNTCAASGGPAYYGKMKVRWYYFDASNNSVAWINRNYYNGGGVPMSFTALPCPGPFTATLGIWPVGATPGGPSVTLSSTQILPNCASTAIECAGIYPNGFGGYTYGSPGSLSVP